MAIIRETSRRRRGSFEPHRLRLMRRLEASGARLYRGPLAIEGGQWMAQVRDPWGNCIGLRQVGLDKSND